MPWHRSDDRFPEHPKCDALAEHFGDDWATLNLAFALWHHMGCDCASRLTNGAFNLARACRVMRAPRESIEAALDGLVKVNLIETAAGGFVFHDWSHYQPSAAEVSTKREEVSRKRAEAGRKGGLKSGEKRGGVAKQTEANGKQTGSKPAKQTEANGQANDEANNTAIALPEGDRSKTEANGRSIDEAPSRPVPSRPRETSSLSPPPGDPPSGVGEVASKSTAKAKGPKPKPAPPSDPVPAAGSLARKIYDALVGDRVLAPIVAGPGDFAERIAVADAYPGVNVLAEVLRAGEWAATKPAGHYRDGRAYLRNWLDRCAQKVAGTPRPAGAPPPAPASPPPPRKPAAFKVGPEFDALRHTLREEQNR